MEVLDAILVIRGAGGGDAEPISVDAYYVWHRLAQFPDQPALSTADVQAIVGTHRHAPGQLPAIVDVVVPALHHSEPLSHHAASAAMGPYPLLALPSRRPGVGDLAPG